MSHGKPASFICPREHWPASFVPRQTDQLHLSQGSGFFSHSCTVAHLHSFVPWHLIRFSFPISLPLSPHSGADGWLRSALIIAVFQRFQSATSSSALWLCSLYFSFHSKLSSKKKNKEKGKLNLPLEGSSFMEYFQILVVYFLIYICN